MPSSGSKMFVARLIRRLSLRSQSREEVGPVHPPDAVPGWPPGHFYSPVPSLEEVASRRDALFSTPTELPGIDLNDEGQVELFLKLKEHYPAQPFSETRQPGFRYFFDNDYFRHGEAIIYYCLLRHLQPKRVIEVGSGFSSAVLLDVNERYFNQDIQCTFIEPFPERLIQLLKETDYEQAGLTIQKHSVQDIPLNVFTALRHNDILFIDSSHVSKIGSDVNHLLFQVLPALDPGVYVHFHDMYYPFEYPEEWVRQGRFWNEAYLVRAFLQHNRDFEIAFFNSYFRDFHRSYLDQYAPMLAQHSGSSLWLRRRGA